MSQVVGEVAALSAALMWTFASVLFTSAGRRIGALTLNALRIVMGTTMLLFTHFFIFGQFFPNASTIQILYLSLSGIIGLAIGDFAYFGALIAIGPRRAMLILSMAPIFSIIGGVLILKEIPSLLSLSGIFLVLLGVWIVIMERREIETVGKHHMLRGAILGIIAAGGQGIGVVISKYGMLFAGPPVNPLSATIIRVIAATLTIWAGLLLWRKPQKLVTAVKDLHAMKLTLLASVIGPFLGLWLSMIAINYAQAGIAATLMSLTPVMIIPVVHFLYGERVNIRGISGAILAVVGVSIIFLF